MSLRRKLSPNGIGFRPLNGVAPRPAHLDLVGKDRQNASLHERMLGQLLGVVGQRVASQDGALLSGEDLKVTHAPAQPTTDLLNDPVKSIAAQPVCLGLIIHADIHIVPIKLRSVLIPLLPAGLAAWPGRDPPVNVSSVNSNRLTGGATIRQSGSPPGNSCRGIPDELSWRGRLQ
jgi:hypothetical protein